MVTMVTHGRYSFFIVFNINCIPWKLKKIWVLQTGLFEAQ